MRLGDHLYGFVAGKYELGKEPTYTLYSLEEYVATWKTCASIVICEPRKLNNNGTYVIATINRDVDHLMLRRGVKPWRPSRYVCFNIHTGRFTYLDGDEDEDSPDGIYRVYGSRNQELDISTESEPVGGYRGRLGPSNGAHLNAEDWHSPYRMSVRSARLVPELTNRVACWGNMRLFREETFSCWATEDNDNVPRKVRASPVTNRRWLPGSTIFCGQEMDSSRSDLDAILALPEPYSTLALTYRLHYSNPGACHEAVFMDETGIVIAGNNSFVTSRWPTAGERSEGRRGGYLGKASWEANAHTVNNDEVSGAFTGYHSDTSSECGVLGDRLINATERYAMSLRQVGWLEAILNLPVTLCESPQPMSGDSMYDIDERLQRKAQRVIPRSAQEAEDEVHGFTYSSDEGFTSSDEGVIERTPTPFDPYDSVEELD